MQSRIEQVSRREWLQSTAAITLAAAGGSAIGGCGRRGPVLKVFNWSDYIDEDAIAQFEEQTGSTLVYDNYSSDSELETRLATGAGSYDVVFPSDRALAALLAKDLLRPLDRPLLPNYHHLDQKFLGRPFDVLNRFSVPYFVGSLAVGIRTDHVKGPVKGLEPLFEPAHRGRITMLDDMENVVAAALAHLGYPFNSVEAEHLAEAQRLLTEQKPLVQAYTSDSYRERLISGEAWAALGWSGDFLQADKELTEVNSEARIAAVIPEGGTMLWMDSMVIPRRAENVELAHAFINHLLEPEVASKNAQSVNYATPNAAARGLLPPEILANESIYPPPEIIDRCGWLKDRGADIEKIERVWRMVRG